MTEPVDSAAITIAAEAIGRALSSRVWAATSERDLQDGIADVLDTMLAMPTMRVVREYRLTDKDRLDFAVILDTAVPDILAIEVKVDGSRVDTARQIARYATHERVGGIVLVTTSGRIAAGFNTRIGGRRVYPLVVRRI